MTEKQFKSPLLEGNGARSLTEATYARLRSDILACVLAPGARLNVKELSQSLGSNPAAVREALSRLTAEDLVIIEPQKGFLIAPMSIADLTDLTSVRIELDVNVLRRSIAAGDLEWEARVVAAWHQLSRTPMSASDAAKKDEWERAHSAFHQALMSACSSTWLVRLRRMLYDQYARYRTLSVSFALADRDLESEHQALKDAALARDVTRATELLTAHLQKTADVVLDTIRRDEAVLAWFADL